jgi:hypothetical protein
MVTNSDVTAPQWMHKAVGQALALMIFACLRHRPANDVVPMVKKVWANALWRKGQWDQERDYPRILAAAENWMGEFAEWPTLNEFYRAMPPKQKQAELPPPEMSDEQVAENKKRLAQLYKEVFTRV